MLPHHIERFQSADWPALAQVINQLAENIEALQLMPGRNLRVTAGAKGFAIDGNPAVEEGAAGTFRGEWIITNSYEAGETVKVSNGLEAGFYIAVQAVPANEPQYFPWLGGRWVLVGRVNDQSSWV